MFPTGNPSPRKVIFSKIAHQTAEASEGWPNTAVLIKCPRAPHSNAPNNHLLALSADGGFLLDILSATFHPLDASPLWQLLWCTWCHDNLHVAMLYRQSDSQHQLQIVNSVQVASNSNRTTSSTPATAGQAFEWPSQDHDPISFSSVTGWSEEAVSPHANAIVLPHGNSNLRVYSLPELVRGPQLLCPMEGIKEIGRTRGWLVSSRPDRGIMGQLQSWKGLRHDCAHTN